MLIVQVEKWNEESEKLKVTLKVCDRAGNRIKALYSDQYINSVNDHLAYLFPLPITSVRNLLLC